jgi:hypothetical protein
LNYIFIFDLIFTQPFYKTLLASCISARNFNIQYNSLTIFSMIISKHEFFERIKQIPILIPSKTNTASYTGFVIDGNILSFYRVIPKTHWSLDLEKLYRVYSTQSFINTTVLKTATKGRVNSPSVAVLMAIGCIDKKGNRI